MVITDCISMMVKVFLVDEHPVMQQSLGSALDKYADFEVVGSANNVQEALSQIDELKPDIVIMDAFKGGNDNINNVEILLQKNVKVFILTDSNRENDFVKAIGAGVKGYVSKDTEVSQLIDAIRLVAVDGAVVYSSKVSKLFDPTLQKTNQADQLSPREKEILNHVAQGHTNNEIANLCFISAATVKAHIRRIFEKLDVKNRAEAVSIGIEKRLIGIRV